MCLAMPMKVIEIKNRDRALVDVSGVQREVSIQTLLEKPKIGDYVIIHAGFAIEVIDEERAKETLELFEEMEEAYENLEGHSG